MAFTKLKLTTFGQTIEAKRHQGKGIHFTRVAIGDGLLGNGSMINRTELVSEKHSMKIDGILTTDDAKQSAVVVTMDNSKFTEGFPYRELALMAQDPDTEEEGVYLYDNAGQECEYLDTQTNGVVIYERLKLLIRVEQTENITFEASGNPIYLTPEDIADLLKKKADLGEDGKVIPEQLPDMDVSEALAAADLKDALVDADAVVITDSAKENVPARVLWSKIKKLFAAATHKHSASDINSGTLAVARGGTGKSSWTANRLVYPNEADSLVQLAFPSTAGSVLRQGTSGPPYWSSISELLSALGLTNVAKIATGSYVGTGTYGSANPCSLTFPFSPKLVLFFSQYSKDSWTAFMYANPYESRMFILPSVLTTDYTAIGFPGCRYTTASYAKRSADGKTISWYNNGDKANEYHQLNDPEYIYHYVAFG